MYHRFKFGIHVSVTGLPSLKKGLITAPYCSEEEQLQHTLFIFNIKLSVASHVIKDI
jgi:hypothetical protein